MLLLVLVRTPQHVDGASPPVARLLLQLRLVSWHTPPRIVIAMGRADAMEHYNDWCLLTDLQCNIAVLGDLSPGGLVRFIHNTDMCCRGGLPTHDVVLIHEDAKLRRGFGERVANAQMSPSIGSCLLPSPCKAYYIPAADFGANASVWTAKGTSADITLDVDSTHKH